MSNEERMMEVLDAVQQALRETVLRRRDGMPAVPFGELVTQFGAHRGVTAEEARRLVETPLREQFALPPDASTTTTS